MNTAVEMTRASVALATQRLKDNMIQVAEENWLPEHVRMLRALIIAADTGMDYQHAYEMANERVDGPELLTKQHNDARWIQASERLPEDGLDVLVWFKFRSRDDDDLIRKMGISYVINGEWSGFINGRTGWNKFNIIAWMPLPEPYRESEG